MRRAKGLKAGPSPQTELGFLRTLYRSFEAYSSFHVVEPYLCKEDFPGRCKEEPGQNLD